MEQKTRKIVVGFDFSPGGRAAVTAALAFARKLGAEITVVTAAPGVIEDGALGASAHVPSMLASNSERVAFLESVEKSARAAVEALGAEGVKIRYDIGFETPSRMILHTAHSGHTDLVIIGATGNEATHRPHGLGVEAARIVRSSRAPVFTVHPACGFPPASILCGVDFSECSERAAGWAIDLGRMFGAKVTIAHVLDDESLRFATAMQPAFVPVPDMKELEARAINALDAFVARFDTSGVTVNGKVLHGRPSQALAQLGEEVKADLVTVGSVGRSAAMESLVGGTTERLLRHLGRSALTVKSDSYKLH
jgi:nucleotide-binding universal stress UspA family protein